jgi:Mu transposase-like protein
VLTDSNWESVTVCFSESYESLAEGLQDALGQLGGVPQMHRTDRLSAAVPPGGAEEFGQRYQALLRHYGLQAQVINVRQAHENGDGEQSHHRFKRALDQALMLRGSRDFQSREEYAGFLRALFCQLNQGRQERLSRELPLLRSLPARRIESARRFQARVDRGRTIHVLGNTYAVSSRLIGEWVEVRLFAQRVEVHYAQRLAQQMPRLRGKGKHRIDYRHVIDALARQPRAFDDYRFRAEMFPSRRFRMAYDRLAEQRPGRAAREYLLLLHQAAREGEAKVEAALARLLQRQQPLSAQAVEAEARQRDKPVWLAHATVGAVDLSVYDGLLEGKEAFAEGGRGGREGGAGGPAEGAAPADGPRQL